MIQVILASASPRRRKLLKTLGLKFKVAPSKFREDLSLKMPPKKLAVYLALQKAKDVARKHPGSIVIGADTIVVNQNKVLGKPGSKQKAVAMLKSLSGRTHRVITAYCIIRPHKSGEVKKAVSTEVKFRKLSKTEIMGYVKTGEPLDKAGAYAIQEKACVFVEKVIGDYNNVAGLPVCALIRDLRRLGVKI